MVETDWQTAIDFSDLIEPPEGVVGEFYSEKMQLAAQDLEFYLTQEKLAFASGYPLPQRTRLRLAARHFTTLGAVLDSLFRLNPSYVLACYEAYPRLCSWYFMRSTTQQLQPMAAKWAIYMLDKTGVDVWCELALRATNPQLLNEIVTAIDHYHPNADQLFNVCWQCHHMSQKMAKAILADEQASTEIQARARLYLLSERHTETVLAVAESETDEEVLFFYLLTREEKIYELQRRFGRDTGQWPKFALRYLYMLSDDLPKQALDLQSQQFMDYVALRATNREIHDVVSALLLTEDMDESLLEQWIEIICLKLGPLVPVTVADLNDADSPAEIVEQLSAWLEHAPQNNQVLLDGKAESFSQVMQVLMHEQVSASLRNLYWQKLCLLGNLYLPWNSKQPYTEQKQCLDAMMTHGELGNRYNLGIANHAVMDR